MSTTTLRVPAELHFKLKRYCIFNNLKLEKYVEEKLNSIPELKLFEEQIQKVKFK